MWRKRGAAQPSIYLSAQTCPSAHKKPLSLWLNSCLLHPHLLDLLDLLDPLDTRK